MNGWRPGQARGGIQDGSGVHGAWADCTASSLPWRASRACRKLPARSVIEGKLGDQRHIAKNTECAQLRPAVQCDLFLDLSQLAQRFEQLLPQRLRFAIPLSPALVPRGLSLGGVFIGGEALHLYAA